MPTRTTRAFLACLIISAAGCANPFKPVRSDYADLPAPNRSLEPLELAPARAPEDTPAADSAPNPFEGLEQFEIGLARARAHALANNLDLEVELINPAIADQGTSEEEARFESAFTLTASFTDVDTPTNNQTQSSRGEFLQVEPGVRVPLLTGGQATVTLPTNRSDTQNPFNTTNRTWETDLALSFSQPLLRGAGRRATTAGLRIASYNEGVTRSRVRLAIINTLASVDRSYWRLYQARKNLEIQQTQFEAARELLGRAERLFNAGSVAEIEVIRAQSGVATRLDGIIRAQRNVLTRQRGLKRLMNIVGLDVQSETLVIPTSDPDPVEYAFDADALAARAVRERAELVELALRLAIDETQIELDKNQKLPLFNLFASYRLNGLDEEWEGAYSSIIDTPYQDEWTLGVNAEVPFGNLLAKSRYRRSLLNRLQRIATKAAREQSIREEVYAASDDLHAGWQSLLAARQAVATSARVLAAERRQFELGASTSTDVLDAVSRLAAEQATEVAALVEYQLAQTELAVATGTVLGAARVSWDEPEATDLLTGSD